MKLTLLPSSLGSGPAHQYLSSSIINDTIAIDAGSLGLWGTPFEQARVQHVLLSHTHMDHLATLPIFVENAFEGKSECVTVYASSDVLEACQSYLFNNRVWPDFIALSTGDKPFLRLRHFEPGQTLDLEGVRITCVALNHVVPTVGYIVADDTASIAFVSDTGPTDAIWQLVNTAKNLKAIFLETTFPDELQWLADVSKHLTPRTLKQELAKIQHLSRLIVIHIKARFQDEVVRQIEALQVPSVEIGYPGTTYTF